MRDAGRNGQSAGGATEPFGVRSFIVTDLDANLLCFHTARPVDGDADE